MRDKGEDIKTVEWLKNHHYDEVTKWEHDFLDSIEDRLTNGMGLTDKQGEVLDRIWNEYHG